MARFAALGLAFVSAFFLLASGTATAADVALVIGNRTYQSAPAARSAEIDARAVADALADGGYDVTLGINLNRQQMRRLLQRFSRKAATADKLVIFYSGHALHALRSGGVSYLAPIDQRNNSLVGVMMDGAPLDLLLELAGRSRGQAVVFIDAAQLNGYTPNSLAEPGLAAIDPGQGVLVVSAAAPGRAVRRRGDRGSRFADEVLREFLAPGARTMNAARSVRPPIWTTGSVRLGLRLISRRGRSRGRVGSGASPAEVEAALGLSRAQRREVQEDLSLFGYGPRGIEGLFGPGTRTAIRLFQRANNQTETGYLTREQLTLLHDQARGAGRPPSGPPGGDREQSNWDRTGALDTADGYRAYLARYSDGRYAAKARQDLKRIARAGIDPAARRGASAKTGARRGAATSPATTVATWTSIPPASGCPKPRPGWRS